MNFDGFLQTLPFMGEGMLVIFAVTGAMILAIGCLQRLTVGKKKDK